MDVILLNRVGKLGTLGSRVTVKDGFARNYLLPQKLAVRATEENIAHFESQRVELEKQMAQELTAAEQRGAALEGMTVTMTARAEDSKLYGSIGTREIADVLSAKGATVEKKEVRLPTGVIRETGEYSIELQLHSDVVVTVTIIVEAE